MDDILEKESEQIEIKRLRTFSFNPNGQSFIKPEETPSFMNKSKGENEIKKNDLVTQQNYENIVRKNIQITNNNYSQNAPPFNISTMNINFYSKTPSQMENQLLKTNTDNDLSNTKMQKIKSNSSKTNTFGRMNSQQLAIKDVNSIESIPNFFGEKNKNNNKNLKYKNDKLNLKSNFIIEESNTNLNSEKSNIIQMPISYKDFPQK
jgi:hypothetical protein